MQINEKKLEVLLELIHSKNMRVLIDLIPIDSAVKYVDLKNKYYSLKNEENHFSSKFAYYLRKLVERGILIKNKENGFYYFTRIGIQVVNLINNFKEICREYDLSDLDADGKVVLKVVGRKI